MGWKQPNVPKSGFLCSELDPVPPAKLTMDDVTRVLRNELLPELPATREIMNIQTMYQW